MTTETITPVDAAVSFDRLDASAPLHAMRRTAFERFQALGFPTLRDEEWRYTSVKPIATTTFGHPGDTPTGAAAVTESDLHAHLLHETDCHRLVFVNGRFRADLSAPGAVPAGVRLLTLADAIAGDFDAVEPWLGRVAEPSGEPFTALNTAFIEDGVALLLPARTVLETPVHLHFVSTPGGEGPAAVTHPRILVVAEEGSQATVVESYSTVGTGTAFTNTITEIVAGERAVVDHYRVQREDDAALHVSGLWTHQAGNSDVTSHCFTGGGGLVRNDIHAVLDGEHANATFNGLFLTHGTQHVDNHLHVRHMEPNCNSWEFYKGILDDRSRGVFSGRIYVAQDAQKTDAKQTSMNLLLSADAKVTAKPQLEIFADDVKCTHGATIGQLEEDQLFYLRARGIPLAAARSLLIRAFANETISEIRIDELRRLLQHELLGRLPHGDLLEVDA
jgi:Fe-S cluster assembly protein SufD